MAALFAAKQPLPYSHKSHVKLGLACRGCHTMPGKGELATFPPEPLCMTCHTSVKKDSPHIQKLARFAEEKKPVPWVRVYRLPRYVWFSHKVHAAKNSCETCHGPVAERDVITQEKPISMTSCMACHEEAQAPNECDTCHTAQ
ncbi:MAG TPA: cytochrome c3 family protein [Bryobacteraceae bacterium]|nr:cytochrome c3 family protein [Bryobacteraceae bacterium]